MAGRHPNPRRVKIHRPYTVEEAARCTGVHRNTVRQWIKRGGLSVCNERKPVLILGRVLREFLTARRQKHKSPCLPGQLYCMRCRAPKRPAGNMADYIPTTSTAGRLCGICPDCEALMNRSVSLAQLSQVAIGLELAMATTFATR